MWRLILKPGYNGRRQREASISAEDLARASSFLFAVFGRFGESVVAFKGIAEFSANRTSKRMILVTPHHAVPYAKTLFKGVEILGVNKHRQPFRILGLVRMLKREPPDVGLNPMSFGLESEYIISYARRFLAWRSYRKYPDTYNLYRRVREYLLLADRPIRPGVRMPGMVGSVVVSPFATDPRRALDRQDLEHLLKSVEKRFPNSRVTMAAMPNERRLIRGFGLPIFVFGKSEPASERFLSLLREADLFVGVDSGPLHLAEALGVPCVGIFGPTAPETILDYDSGVQVLRHPSLDGIFCSTHPCSCIHELFRGDDFMESREVRFDRTLYLEKRRCPLRREP